MITVDVEKQVFADGLTVSNYTLLVNMCGWCEERFGPHLPGGEWYYHGLGRFTFRKPKDATLFLLRWL